MYIVFCGSNIFVRQRFRGSCGSGSCGGRNSYSDAPLAELLAQLGEEISLFPPVGEQSGLGFLNFDIDTVMKT